MWRSTGLRCSPDESVPSGFQEPVAVGLDVLFQTAAQVFTMFEQAVAGAGPQVAARFRVGFEQGIFADFFRFLFEGAAIIQ